MKKINTLRELQLVSIHIYKDLLQFCQKHDLTLYLHGGSLIGAVRHQSYIPWDDDIDVCMSRVDYDKLVKLSGGIISDTCRLIDPETHETFNGYIPVVVYDQSRMVSKQYRTNEELKIGISIFVYDGIIENRLWQKWYYLYMYILRAQHALCRADFKHVHTKKAKKIGTFLQFFYNSQDTLKYKQKILMLQKKYSYSSSQSVSTNADYQPELQICSKESFESSVPLLFEGIPSATYSHYNDHLRKYYGDYMVLPPKEHQKPKHGFEAWIADSFEYGLFAVQREE